MRIGIIGAGSVGQALGEGLARAGHDVVYGVRDPQAPREELRPAEARVATVRDAVVASDAIILATPWKGAEDALRQAGDMEGKPLLDATNPIGPGFVLTHGHSDSGAEQVARWAGNARVVKIFNSTGVENMANPAYGQAKAMMLYAGDDEAACDVAATLAGDLGFEPVRLGALAQARLLEPMAMAWITLAMMRGYGRNIAFGLLRR